MGSRSHTVRSCFLVPAIAIAIVASPRNSTAQHLLHGASGLDHGVPDLCQSPTVVSARPGAWSDPGTWSPARVPAAGDRVRVTAGIQVTYDVMSDDALQCIGVAGTLRFRNDADTRLSIADLMVLPTGTLEIGTVDAPIAAGKSAIITIVDKPIDTTLDPDQFGRGLIGLGTVRIHGQAKDRTFSDTTAELASGQTSFDLAAPVN